jgi:cytoskeletal protein RodZ
VIRCFAHRINNILTKGFYQKQEKKEKRIILASTTPSSKQKKSKIIVLSSSSSSSSDDETTTPSPSKYAAANTSLSELSSKAKELLDIITTCKQLVKYVKLVKQQHRETNHIYYD